MGVMLMSTTCFAAGFILCEMQIDTILWGGIPFFRGRWKEVNFEYNIEDRKMKIYRRPPEGEEDA